MSLIASAPFADYTDSVGRLCQTPWRFYIRRIRVIRRHMRFLLLLALVANAFGTGLASYPHLLVADSSGAAGNGVRVTYLGTNGANAHSRIAVA